MSKQDRTFTRTAPDLERKYNLGRSLTDLEETRRIANSAKATADSAAMLASKAEIEVRNLKEYVDNGLAGKVPAVESETYTGCYFRMVGEEAEWLNPPMVIDTEYRTTERWNGKAVYTSLTKISGLPNGAYGSYTLVATDCDNMIGHHVAYERSDGATFLELPEAGQIYYGSYGSPYIVFGNTQSDLSNMTAYVTLYYTKTT